MSASTFVPSAELTTVGVCNNDRDATGMLRAIVATQAIARSMRETDSCERASEGGYVFASSNVFDLVKGDFAGKLASNHAHVASSLY